MCSDYHQASFHSEEALHRLWGGCFEIRAILPGSIDSIQGAVICTPKM